MPEGIGYDEPAYKGKASNPHTTEKTQLVATGAVGSIDQTKVEEDARINGVSLEPIGGHGQGGEGH